MQYIKGCIKLLCIYAYCSVLVIGDEQKAMCTWVYSYAFHDQTYTHPFACVLWIDTLCTAHMSCNSIFQLQPVNPFIQLLLQKTLLACPPHVLLQGDWQVWQEYYCPTTLTYCQVDSLLSYQCNMCMGGLLGSPTMGCVHVHCFSFVIPY